MAKYEVSQEVLNLAKDVLNTMKNENTFKQSLGDPTFPGFYVVRGEPVEGLKVVSLETAENEKAYIVSL